MAIVDIDNGELDLPEELPEFPDEQELCQEIENSILQFGGHEGAELLKEHAIEERDNLATSYSNNWNYAAATTATKIVKHQRSNSIDTTLDNDGPSDTMAQLNLMISKFESISQQQAPKGSNVGRGFGRGLKSNDSERLRLNNAVREVFCNRSSH